MLEEMHYTKKDFRVEWFSGTGKGGQHRNKHQNCCRIIHISTGLRAQGTESRERPTNQRTAFERLAKLLLSQGVTKEERRTDTPAIRNYHAERNEVHDKASGLKLPYKTIVIDGDIGPMVEARKQALKEKEA